MADDNFSFSSEAELAAQINRAIDNWDSRPTPEERARITAEWVAEQIAWERKLAAAPPAARARLAVEGADEAEARLDAKRSGLVARSALNHHLQRLAVVASEIVASAQARVDALITPTMSGAEIDAVAENEAKRAEEELRACAHANRPPTLADDDRAIATLLRDANRRV